jgi:hypothetical protein
VVAAHLRAHLRVLWSLGQDTFVTIPLRERRSAAFRPSCFCPYVAVDVRLSDGRRRLFRLGDLQEISSARSPWWRRSLLEDNGSTR